MTDTIPVFDLEGVEGQQSVCEALAKCLKDTGLLLVKDPRVSAADNDEFLDLMEQYFANEDAAKKDTRPELCYQVGLTPSGVETPRVLLDEEMQQRVKQLPQEHAATMPQGPDVKCRYMWRCGPRPEKTAFPELNAQPVIPEAYPQWQRVMDGFSSRLLDVAHTVAKAAAVGFGLPPDALLERMKCGPHILAPTGSDLERHGEVGTVLAGYHSDLNLLTVHGKSRFPGLFVWTADGTKVAVKVPQGCLLVQAGQQLEALTGGYVKAGMHEVVVTPQTRAALGDAKAHGRSTWRVSSTLFCHLASDAILEPLGHFAHTQPEALQRYPPRPAGFQVQQELEAISLKSAKRRESLGGVQQQPPSEHSCQPVQDGETGKEHVKSEHQCPQDTAGRQQQHQQVNDADGKENVRNEEHQQSKKQKQQHLDKPQPLAA
mmetsp:Transcript_6798/g.18255  ORF Transcript_6798/g.18255 Transcript_6798/m.18255 type:complete len:431 (+) Transcript_6798:65-1357(+)|eukprot:CAMPEP_0202357196 /NCGR_PEP_ID=MMETSP1126-20121109/11321_1 /ASSEMBLY_ACC=CAM_ASM_000457 /TAXON_ID=3047 /ORGANISM="Dunaliella tertiolecta, Strain CCMP1320" /LENGTH=430 /DNA_ID=CAMNT_0048950031 /DNA_START=153 /DNA_END=1445 /DNA_ORIENTATION=+